MQRPQAERCLASSKNHKQAVGWREMGWGRVVGDRSERGAAGRPHGVSGGGSFIQTFAKYLPGIKHHAQRWGALAA